MPTKVNKHPITVFLSNFLCKNILENIAVVMITPPFEICQTLLEIKLRAKYDSPDPNKSVKPGIMGR